MANGKAKDFDTFAQGFEREIFRHLGHPLVLAVADDDPNLSSVYCESCGHVVVVGTTSFVDFMFSAVFQKKTIIDKLD